MAFRKLYKELLKKMMRILNISREKYINTIDYAYFQISFKKREG